MKALYPANTYKSPEMEFEIQQEVVNSRAWIALGMLTIVAWPATVGGLGALWKSQRSYPGGVRSACR